MHLKYLLKNASRGGTNFILCSNALTLKTFNHKPFLPDNDLEYHTGFCLFPLACGRFQGTAKGKVGPFLHLLTILKRLQRRLVI